MKILSVDDKDENLYMLEALLRGHGHQVDSASNGREALRLAEGGGYDLIVSDILMPVMDGFQLCRQVKKDPELRSTPFIFYTATYTDPRDAAFALGLGANRFLVKPVEPEAFLKHVEEVVALGHKPLKPSFDQKEPPEDESIYLKEYNARLIAKLEQKMIDLENANRVLHADILDRERVEAERAKLEQQLRQSQKLEAVGTLAGGIAHDFNNILAGIIGFSELGLSETEIAAAKSHFGEILRASRRAQRLIEQILAFSRKQERPQVSLRIQETIAEALELLRATLPTQVEIRTDIDPDAPSVLADATEIHQIVMNLTTNAWQAIEQRSGCIGIDLKAVDVDEETARLQPDMPPGKYVRLSVSDTGSGMTKETAERIFEPFFTTKGARKGSGLGLSVVHGIVKSSHGVISVYTELGRGTTFHLYFPAVETCQPAPPARSCAVDLGAGECILFVDDEPVLTMLGERFLTKLGYTPVVTNDPLEALELFRANAFDLVITDMTMPNASGVELARQILAIRPGTPLILTTGYSATLEPTRVRALGFGALLLKPYNMRTLGECVQKLLAGARNDGPNTSLKEAPHIGSH